MTNTPSVSEDMKTLKEKLGKNPGVILENLPEAGQLSMAQILECLPENMWKRLDGSRFIDVLGEISTWGDLTTLVHTVDVILEFSGPFPKGTLGHGYYNLGGNGSLHGHLRPNHCESIYLVERPFMGSSTTASIQFMNKDGQAMFKIYLGRDENRKIQAHQLEAFRALSGSAHSAASA